MLLAQPGTEMKVTPEMLAPIMPKATKAQCDERPARKKASLPCAPPRALRRERMRSRRK